MKKCKGIGKAKEEKGCDVVSLNRKFGLCPSCLYNWATTTENGKIWHEKQFLPKVKKIENKRKKEEEIKIKDEYTNWRNKLKEKIQAISRLIDIGLPCLALGYHPNQIHGGHVYSAGSNKTISLNLHNIHRQSAQSNHSHNDDGLLREKLALEYGQDYFEFVSRLRQCSSLHYTNLEYKVFYKKACNIYNSLKRKGLNFNTEERIQERNRINKEIGVYDNKYCEFKP